jgi:hypothetical protein
MPGRDRAEPTDAKARIEFYRGILAAIPEYDALTQSGEQMWSISDAAAHLPLSAHELRQAFAAGRLPGAVPGSGSRGMEIPRSALIVHLGRLVTGWYDRQSGGQQDSAPSAG